MNAHYRVMLAAAVSAGLSLAATHETAAKELSLSYFMGSKHPMNKAVFTPFAKKLEEVSGGNLTVKQFAGGALNSKPPKQYSILVKGVADIAFAIPGYTAKLFPVTSALGVPNVAKDSVDGTEKLWNAKALIEKEYNAKVLALWANQPPVLLTRNKPVRTLEDMKGLKVRVPTAQSVPFVEALGASAISQPVTVINQNLQNGTIDAILIGASAIRSFKLHEPAKYMTVGVPGSGSAFVLLMNKKLYDSMSDQEKKWIDEASGKWLSDSGGKAYDRVANGGKKLAISKGVKRIDLSKEEIAKFNAAMAPAMKAFRAKTVSGELTGAQVLKAMQGK